MTWRCCAARRMCRWQNATPGALQQFARASSMLWPADINVLCVSSSSCLRPRAHPNLHLPRTLRHDSAAVQMVAGRAYHATRLDSSDQAAVLVSGTVGWRPETSWCVLILAAQQFVPWPTPRERKPSQVTAWNQAATAAVCIGASWQGGNHKELFDICFNSEAKKRSRASSANTHSLTEQQNKTRHKTSASTSSFVPPPGRRAAARVLRYVALATGLSCRIATRVVPFHCPSLTTPIALHTSVRPSTQAVALSRPARRQQAVRAPARAASVHDRAWGARGWGARGSDAISEVHL